MNRLARTLFSIVAATVFASSDGNHQLFPGQSVMDFTTPETASESH